MTKNSFPVPNLPRELENVARIEDVSALDEKVKNCYSRDRYEDFQTAVKTITLDVLGSDGGREKVKTHAKEAAKEYLEEKGWKEKNFWIPIWVSIVAIIVSIIAIFVK